MTKLEYVCHHLGKHIQADTDVQHHMLIIHLLQEVWQLKEDIKEMKEKAERCCEGGPHWGHSYSCKEVMH